MAIHERIHVHWTITVNQADYVKELKGHHCPAE
jgi:hypothetical protein